MKETNEFDVLLRVVEVIEKKITLQHNSISSENKETIQIGIAKIDLIINKSEINMGDKIKIEKSQIGAVGSNAQAMHNTFNQQINDLPENYDYERLNEQLLLLRNELAIEANSTEHYKALGEVANAEEASQKKDGKGVIKHLMKAGKWVFDKAQEIGIDIVTELIKKQMGL